MKHYLLNFIVFSSLIILFAGCKDDKDNDPVPVTNGNVYIVFENIVDGQPVEFGNLSYTNEAGNTYSVDMLKYYISNLVFVKFDNSLYPLSNYELIDETFDTSKTFMVSLPVGDYKKIKFLMGVDSTRSVSGAQAGELDPLFGMFWDWNTGYVYLKHEGTFIDAFGDTLPLVYHFGGMEALTLQELNLTLPVSQETRIIKISFNLNKLYRNPNTIDFNNNNIHSGGANWITSIRENVTGVFAVDAVL